MDEVQMAKMEKLFTTAYYLAINERPFSDFPKLLELQAVNGLSLGETYFTDIGCQGICWSDSRVLLRRAEELS